MKLSKLAEDFQTSTKNINVNRPIGQVKPAINSGAFSKVEPKKNDPFLVRKTSMPVDNENPETDDGYWSYIQNIISHPELKNNPFLPRVYNIKKITDPNGKVVMRADIEKLTPFTDIDPEILISYLGTLVDAEVWDRYIERNKIEPLRNEIPLNYFLSTINIAMHSGNYDTISNTYLIEALKFINDMSDLFRTDIKHDNMMFRRGNHGIQLVITDPLGLKY